MVYDNCLVMKIFTIGLPAECESTNEYPKTENYYPTLSLEIQVSQRMFSFPLFLQKILSTANVT